MTDPTQPPRFPAWFAPAVVVLLGMQLILAWLQGGLLHRQHQELQALREDVQTLADTLEQSNTDDSDADAEPARQDSTRTRRLQRTRLAQAQPTPNEEDQAQKDLQDAKASAQKAISEAREVQSKLSIEENIRKADEKAKVDAAENAWQKWFWLAAAVGAMAVGVRSWLRRRT